jgi:16S rRNA processing protein RimM
MHPMPSAPQWVVLARILRPQGRKGEVLADLFTDFPSRFDSRPRVWLAAPGSAEAASPVSADAAPEAPAQSAEVVSYFLPTGRNAGRIVLQLAGVETIEQAETLAGKEVIVPLSERVPLEPGAAYVSDLIGCTVYDGDLPVGVVDGVQFPTTPDGSRRLEEATALLEVVSSEGHEVLVPFTKAFLIELDLAGRSIRMALPEGLIEINRRATHEG